MNNRKPKKKAWGHCALASAEKTSVWICWIVKYLKSLKVRRAKYLIYATVRFCKHKKSFETDQLFNIEWILFVICFLLIKYWSLMILGWLNLFRLIKRISICFGWIIHAMLLAFVIKFFGLEIKKNFSRIGEEAISNVLVKYFPIAL